MRRLLVAAALALALALPASAGAARFHGYLPPKYRASLADAATRVPMPHGTITIWREACEPVDVTCYDDGDIYMAAHERWSRVEERFILLHELGHAVDERNLRPGHRRAFRQALDLQCRWMQAMRHGCGQVVPAEMFAEQYAACAAGVSRLLIADAYLNGAEASDPLTGGELGSAWFYEYAPPTLLIENALCDLIRTAH